MEHRNTGVVHPFVRIIVKASAVLGWGVALAGISMLNACGGAQHGDEYEEAQDDEGELAVPVILHGRVTATDPAVVKVQRHHGRGGLGVCTGTVIAPQYVLTARHCAGSGRLEVLVDEGPHTTRIAVTRAHFDRPTGRHESSGDIAVLELANAATVAPIPVNLDSAEAMNVRAARAVGFGLTGSRSEDEKKRTVDFASRTTSEFIESERGGVVCYGDSGGPTLALIEGREQVVAVTSHMTSTRCSSGRLRSVRTDRHRTFLQPFVAALPTPASPPPEAKSNPAPTTPTPVITPAPATPATTPAPVRPPVLVPPVRPIPPRALPTPRPVPPPPPPVYPREPIASSGSARAHAHASSSNGRTRASAHVDGSGAHAEAHAY